MSSSGMYMSINADNCYPSLSQLDKDLNYLYEYIVLKDEQMKGSKQLPLHVGPKFTH
jgi:hypothetical protein